MTPPWNFTAVTPQRDCGASGGVVAGVPDVGRQGDDTKIYESWCAGNQ